MNTDDQREWRELLRTAQQASYRILRSYELSEDCASIAIEQLVEAERRGPVANRCGWVTITARRRAIDILRARRIHDELPDDRALDAAIRLDDVADTVLSSDTAHRLLKLVQALPEPGRSIVLGVIEDQPMAEIAQRLQISERAAESHLYRARRKLKAAWIGVVAGLLWRGKRSKALTGAGLAASIGIAGLILAPMTHSPTPMPANPSCLDCGQIDSYNVASSARGISEHPHAASLVTLTVPQEPRPARISETNFVKLGTGKKPVRVYQQDRPGNHTFVEELVECIRHPKLGPVEFGC